MPSRSPNCETLHDRKERLAPVHTNDRFGSEITLRNLKHTWGSKERKDAREYAPDSSHCCYRARGVELKGVDDVIERGLEYH